MASKVVTILKYVGLFSIVFFTITSCEKEIEDIGVDLIENNKFTNGDFVSDVVSDFHNVERVPSNGVAQYLLGLYSDNEFGKLKGDIVSQILLPTIGASYTYGEEAAIDSTILYIPYQVTSIDDYDDGKPKFEIDSVFGNEDNPFTLGVYELNTFLNTLDPSDPTKPMIYYSDKVFDKGTEAFYSGDFKINPDDTVAYIKRYMPDGITVYDTDTIKELDSKPTIKLPLNEQMIQQFFVENASGSEFSSQESFVHYFRGFYLEAKELYSSNSQLLSLDMEDAKMVIYYSNTVDEGEQQDLDGDGEFGEENVRIKESYNFLFGSNKSNSFVRDYSNSKQSGPDRLYVQGAAGSIATIDLFPDGDLPELREDELLITGANITLFVDQDASSDIVPEQLFIYNYQDNEQILDMLTEGLASVQGNLVRDDDGKPYKYVFRIVDYVSELLKSEDPENLVTLGIKVYNPSDLPTSLTDIVMQEYSWIPQGVVLFDQNPNAGDKKARLNIFYAKLNN